MNQFEPVYKFHIRQYVRLIRGHGKLTKQDEMRHGSAYIYIYIIPNVGTLLIGMLPSVFFETFISLISSLYFFFVDSMKIKNIVFRIYWQPTPSISSNGFWQWDPPTFCKCFKRFHG